MGPNPICSHFFCLPEVYDVGYIFFNEVLKSVIGLVKNAAFWIRPVRESNS